MKLQSANLSCFVPLLWAASLIGLTLKGYNTASTNKQRNSCDQILESIRHQRITSPLDTNLDLTGTWLSQRCEIRPGPEYILRRYHFINNTHFKILQFYYTDPYCSRPFYTLKANGIVKQNGRQQSWIVKGATEAPSPILLQVSVLPHTPQAAAYLLSNAALSGATCSQLAQRRQNNNEPIVILSYVEYEHRVLRDLDCTKDLGFNLHELRLIRLEEHWENHNRIRLPEDLTKKNNKSNNEKPKMRQLSLGSIATLFRKRVTFSPTSFQTPLIDAQSRSCSLCAKLLSAHMQSPPILEDESVDNWNLQGEWVSTQCESHNGGTFVTRRMLFESNKHLWHCFYYYYNDVTCRNPYFIIYATGELHGGQLSENIYDARDYNFSILRLSIIPRDLNAVALFNEEKAGGCGQTGYWVVNVAQEVTGTNGCVLLGVKVPDEIEQIVRVQFLENQHYLLFVGEMPNAGESATQRERPTSFQAPLIRCRTQVNERRNTDIVTKFPILTKPTTPFVKDSGNTHIGVMNQDNANAVDKLFCKYGFLFQLFSEIIIIFSVTTLIGNPST